MSRFNQFYGLGGAVKQRVGRAFGGPAEWEERVLLELGVPTDRSKPELYVPELSVEVKLGRLLVGAGVGVALWRDGVARRDPVTRREVGA
jgi:hypothetical protein